MQSDRPSPEWTDPAPARDDGVALILVIIWSAVLLLLAAVVSTAVLNQVRPSDQAEKSYQAWAAAEAGVEDVRARLAANGDYWKTISAYYADPLTNAATAVANPALAGWVGIPGGDSDAQYTYFVDTTNASRTGRMIISATGKAGSGTSEAVRTVEAEVQKRTTNEYAYLSNSEAYPYDAPDVYGPPGATSKDKKMSRDVAEVLCGTGGSGGDHYWYDWTEWIVGGVLRPLGQVTAQSATNATITGYGPHRNSSACLFGEVKTTDRWVGPIHTNDVWYFSPSIPNIDPNLASGLSTQVFNGRVSSSCPGVTPGSAVNGTCRDNHRWISTAKLPGESSRGTDPTTTIVNEIPDDASENGKLWNPEYDSPVEMPSDAMIGVIKNLAKAKGCLFSGPTRVRLKTVGGAGRLVITSPDTVDTGVTSNAFCGGTALYASDPKSHPTITLDYASMIAAGFNGLIYVEDSPLGSAAPSCQLKTADPKYASYPWVIPQVAADTITASSGTPLGMPPLDTGSPTNPKPGGIDEWTNDNTQQCWKGHAFVQSNKDPLRGNDGGYTGQYTIASDADIIITDDIIEASVTDVSPASAGWGIPNPTSTNQLGLVPKRWLYIFHLSASPSKGGDQNAIQKTLENLLLNFSILAPNKCLATQDYNSQPNMGQVKMVGSIGQDNRCRITDPSSGYTTLSVVYDERLALLGPPPYMAELSQEPWKVKTWSESNVRRDPLARAGIPAIADTQTKGTTKSFNVLSGTPSGTTLLFARVLSGTGTVQVSGGQVQYVAPNGVTTSVLEFVALKPDGTAVGQTLTVSVS